ncbi:hypothetical protein FisN_7Lh206 [Fistulifera solaris]|uniref:Uncharacterized protein n=1 Tax=Fistulifera solaris TaxID=1519565 RepID=A0A1Z5JDG6_FISSO|nr:hypothetical protein FisN_7Lh206 [Fistulifera solaris]|eukprot:GAX11818.1 hypothetical protein FisN_7Lh206 [Fistulifera solaris]
MSCGLDACEPDHFCSLDDPSSPRCLHCAFCSVLKTGCPAQCSCTSHEQCGTNAYCALHDTNQNVCTSCENCPHRRPLDGACPDYCFCTSSQECAEGSYCQRQRSGIPADQGLCMSCASQMGCAEHVLLSKQNEETCRDVCPYDYECQQHADCVYDGSWCSFNHRCHNCSQACWTEQRLLLEPNVQIICDNDCNTTALLEERTSHLPLDEWSELPYTSIDYSCPKTCCDWGMQRPQQARATSFTVGPCIASTNVHGAWYDGSQVDWKSPQDFVSQSTPCRRIQYHFEKGFPEVVSDIVCNEVIPPCASENRTLALLITNETHTVFVDSFPFVETYDDIGFTCVLEVAASEISATFFLSLGILGAVFFLIILFLSRRSKKS